VVEADIVAEASRLIREAEHANVPLRALGGVAVRLHSPPVIDALLERHYNDLDFMTVGSGRKRVPSFMQQMGYVGEREFNALNGFRRLLFWDGKHKTRVDIFVDVFEMCHRVPIGRRFRNDPLSIPLAELLLSKLQVVELNHKDMQDILTLLCYHDVSEDDSDAINISVVARLCAADWGLWRTSMRNIAKVERALEGYGLQPEQNTAITDRLTRLRVRVNATSKSTGWRIRNRIGDRVRWYNQPEEP
jgi:hypothetical protein